MKYFDTLWNEFSAAHTPWILLVIALALVVGRLAPGERPKFQSVVFFLAMHIVSLIAIAGLDVADISWADGFRTPAWIFGAVAALGAVSSALFSALLPRLHLRIPLILQDVLVALGSILIAVAVASRAHVNLSGLIATSAVITAVLGFSLQEVISNVAGGLALQIDRSIEHGDWIQVGDVSGQVVQIRWRYTAIETRNWETVLIPNSALMKSQVVVLGRRQSMPRQLRRWIQFNVDWRTQPSEVIDVIESALKSAQLAHVAKDPAPSCILVDMADTFGRYAVRYWLTDLSNDDPTDSAVRSRVYFALQRAAIPLALPAHALFVTEETAARQTIKTERQLRRRSDLLGAIELFSVLSDAERSALAPHLKYAPFARGETMTRQGSEAHWLYLVEEGRITVKVSDGQRERSVAQLQGPTVFGEMSLLTGEPRSATVVAETDVECFRLDRMAFEKVIVNRPEMAQQLASLLTSRRAELDSAKVDFTEPQSDRGSLGDAHELLAKIRSFFSLG